MAINGPYDPAGSELALVPVEPKGKGKGKGKYNNQPYYNQGYSNQQWQGSFYGGFQPQWNGYGTLPHQTGMDWRAFGPNSYAYHNGMQQFPAPSYGQQPALSPPPGGVQGAQGPPSSTCQHESPSGESLEAAKRLLAKHDGKYQEFLAAEEAAVEEAKLAKQAALLTSALKPSLDALAASIAAVPTAAPAPSPVQPPPLTPKASPAIVIPANGSHEDDGLVTAQQASMVNIILEFKTTFKAGLSENELTEQLAKVFGNTQSPSKQKACARAFTRYCENQNPKVTIPRNASDKAKLLVHLVRGK